MKWKATQDETGEETREEQPISTTQTDFLAFSSLLLGYFETYPSKHSCIHSYFIPPPFPRALTLFFDQRREVGSQQEGSLPAKKGERRPIHHCTSCHTESYSSIYEKKTKSAINGCLRIAKTKKTSWLFTSSMQACKVLQQNRTNASCYKHNHFVRIFFSFSF